LPPQVVAVWDTTRMRDSDVYEFLVRDIFESLGKLDGIQNLKVERKVYLDGLSTNADDTKVKHEIDVCVRYEQFGMKNLIVIQAKHWKTPVDLPTLMTFRGVLTDLPGNPRGVLVTKSGFDKGNLFGVAKTYNIGLYVLDEIAQGAFAPSIELTGEMKVDGVHVKDFFFDNPYDADLAKQLLEADTGSKDIRLYNNDGKDIGSLDGAITNLATRAREQHAKDGQVVSLRFEIEGRPVFIHTSNPELPRMRIAIIQGTYFSKVLASGKTETKLTHALRLLTNDQNYYVDSDHNVHRANGIFAHKIELKGKHEGQEIHSSFAFGANIADLEAIHKLKHEPKS